MRLGVSQLGWAPEQEDEARALMAGLGVTAIEAVPTMIAPWEALDAAALRDFRRRWADAGIGVSSLQAIFFGRPDAQLLGDPAQFEAMAEHLRQVGAIAAALGAGVAVFGAPRNRNRGTLEVADAESLAAERLRHLGDVVQGSGLVLGMEPVPAEYGSDMMMRAESVLRVVDACGHPNVRPHLDTACVTLGGDDIAAAIAAAGPALCHFHAAEPKLGAFTAPSPAHAAAAAALRDGGYAGHVVIEMKQGDGVDLAALEQAIRFTAATYGEVIGA